MRSFIGLQTPFITVVFGPILYFRLIWFLEDLCWTNLMGNWTLLASERGFAEMWWYFPLQLTADFSIIVMFNFIPVPQNNQFFKWMDVWWNPIISYVKNRNHHPINSQPTNKWMATRGSGLVCRSWKMGLGERFYSGWRFQQQIKSAHVRQMSQISQSSEIFGIANSTNQKCLPFFHIFGSEKKKHFTFFSPASCCQQTFLFSSHPKCAENEGGMFTYLPSMTKPNVGKHSIHGASGYGMGFCPKSRFSGILGFSVSWGFDSGSI